MLKMAKAVDLSYNIFKKEMIDKQIQEIIDRSAGFKSYPEIITLINKTLKNRMIITQKLSAQHSATLYRIVPDYEGIKPEKQISFHNPPPEKTKLNRANIEGHPVLYCSKDILTAFKEMKDLGLLDKEYYLAEWDLTIESPIDVLSMVMNSKSLQDESLFSELAHMQRNMIRKMVANAGSEIEEQFAYASQKVGDLFALPGSACYSVTSALVHYSLYEMRKIGADIPCVIYPSFINDVEGLNFAFHPNVIEAGILKLKKVYRYRLPVNSIISSGLCITIEGMGMPGEHGQVLWTRPMVEVKISDIRKIVVVTYNGCRFIGQRALDLPILGTKETVQGLIEHQLNETIVEESIKLHVGESVRKSLSQDVTVKYDCMIGLKKGTKVSTEKGESCIHHIYIPLKL